MKPGTLFFYEGNTCLLFCSISNGIIQSHGPRHHRETVTNKPPFNTLLFVKKLDYFATKKTVVVDAVGEWSLEILRAASAATVTEACLAGRGKVIDWRAAKKEFVETGKIPGGIFLAGSGKLIWISHYDQKALRMRLVY